MMMMMMMMRMMVMMKMTMMVLTVTGRECEDAGVEATVGFLGRDYARFGAFTGSMACAERAFNNRNA